MKNWIVDCCAAAGAVPKLNAASEAEASSVILVAFIVTCPRKRATQLHRLHRLDKLADAEKTVQANTR